LQQHWSSCVIWNPLKQNWRKDWRDSPVFPWQLRHISRAVSRAMADRGALSVRPSLRGTLPDPTDGRPVVLACCDDVYFYRFARQLAFSAVDRSPATRIHLHIYEPGPICIADAEALGKRLHPHLTVSHDGPERNPCGEGPAPYFTGGRFAVAAEILAASPAPLMVIDADGIVRADLAPEFSKIPDCDVGLILRPRRKKPWRRVLACATLFQPTAAGRRLADDLSAAIHLSLQCKPHYHVDQTAMAFLLDAWRQSGLPLRIAELGMTWGDHDFADSSAIWSAKGARKREMEVISLQQARDYIIGTP
jgi:hypothetical protein